MYENPKEWKVQRDKKMKLASNICEDCGGKAKVVHHRDKAKVNHSLDNLQALCCSCHKAYHPTNQKGVDISSTASSRKELRRARDSVDATLCKDGCLNVTYLNYREKLGKAIEERREANGLSKASLASKIDGVCSRTISRIEKGDYTHDMSLTTIQKVCSKLGFTVTFAFGGAS